MSGDKTGTGPGKTNKKTTTDKVATTKKTKKSKKRTY